MKGDSGGMMHYFAYILCNIHINVITHIIYIHLDVGILQSIAAMASKMPPISKPKRVVSFCQNVIDNVPNLIQRVLTLLPFTGKALCFDMAFISQSARGQ